MKMNNFLIASFPDIDWDGEIRGTLSEFLDSEGFVLKSYPHIKLLLLYNDIRNLEAFIRGGESVPMIRGTLDAGELKLFCDSPFTQAPDYIPEWLVDFFEHYRDASERSAHIDELYTSYFNNLKNDAYLEFFSKTVSCFRTAVAALRIAKDSKPLESLLRGDEETSEIILNHRSSADLGLKAHFPEITQILSIFERGVIERERMLDLLLISILDSFNEAELFGDQVIYNYIYSLLLRDRWCGHNEAAGFEFIEALASA